MTAPGTDPQPIDYATPAAGEEIPFIAQMLRWRSICWVFFWTMVVVMFVAFTGITGSLIPAVVEIISFAVTSVSAVISIIYMGRAAMSEVGPGYAVRHILLAVGLSFFLFFGVWVIPALVQSDLVKWRAIEDRSKTGVK